MKYIKKNKPFFTDKRGEMFFLTGDNFHFTSALLIHSKKNSIRANHYHKKDSHYVYLLKGKMEYVYKELSTKDAKKKSILVNEGEMVFTPPMEIHAMKFLEDSIFLTLTTESRDQKKYEEDLIRVKLI